MPIDILTRKEIAERMILRMLGRNINITDLTPISNARIIMESFADEFASLHASIAKAQNQFFINTAIGADLDRRLLDFGLTRPTGVPSSGSVTIEMSEDSIVPSGTSVRTNNGIAFTVQGSSEPDGNWTFGTEYPLIRNVDVVCQQNGVIGNVSANSIVKSDSQLENVKSITNPNPFSNGRDVYNDEEFRQYFREHLASLRGGTKGAIISGIKNFFLVTPPGSRRIVRHVAFEETDGVNPIQGESPNVSCVIYISEGSVSAENTSVMASASLVNAVQKLVDGTDGSPGLRSAGVICRVTAARAFPVPVSVRISLDQSFNYETVKNEIQNKVENFFYDTPICGTNAYGRVEGHLNYARLFNLINDIEGVLVADFEFPRQDIFVPYGSKLILEKISITKR